MRISDQLLVERYLTGLNKTKSDMQKIQHQILTQSKINKPSDSPSGTVRSLRIEEQLSSHATYMKNIDNGLAFLQTSVTTVEDIQDEVQNVRVILSELNNPTIPVDNYESFADKIDLALNALLDLANTEYDGKYILGGTDFAEAPYGYNAAGTAIELQVTSVAGEHKIKINKETVQKINITGQELFGNIDGTDVFNTLISIRDNLRAGVKPTTAQAEALKPIEERLTNKLTTTGEIMNRLSSTKELLESQEIELQDLLQKEIGIDTTEAVIDLQNQQYYLDLSYKLSSMILPKSLLDFM